MKTSDIRSCFLDFFAEKGHTVVPSSSLVPHGDPTLLFTNAGMVQFKNVFLGKEHRDYVRACSSQKCVRAGGKHNDLENVGHTARHHTFFEMLGNFSFGDYFKKEAIEFAWEFLIERLKLDPERLFITVFEEDDEAYDLWVRGIGISTNKIARIGARDNFWSMGETGPCGPCSEIFYDHGPEIPGGPPGSADEDGDRFVEIWNLVFMQFDRDDSGQLTPLPKPSVDTGMGLERIAAVMQGVHSNYDIDLFRNLIAAASNITGVRYSEDSRADVSLRVLADHLRSVSFLIADGVLPSNEGRGFVLRRILRRACRHGRLLGMREAFIHRLVPALVAEMGDHFVELRASQTNIEQVIRIEEERFIATLDKGLSLVEEAAAKAGEGGTIPGKTLFTLYDTYGFPLDLTADILKGRNIRLDIEGFEACMEEQRERARAAWGGSGEQSVPRAVFELRERFGPTEFLGYRTLEAEGSVVGLLADEKETEHLQQGQKGWLIANQTPFYAESGGQVGDSGTIETADGVFKVEDTKKLLVDLHVHLGRVVSGCIRAGGVARFVVDAERRQHIRRHHTATHLLHAALREVLGTHVKQAGSLVDDQKLRFDFSHFQALTHEELEKISMRVNDEIMANVPVETKIMSPSEAIEQGAMALFGEKYGDEVRVVTAGISTELCGGTHVTRTGDIGPFFILSETGIAAGVRRIEAVAGVRAWNVIREHEAWLEDVAARLKSRPAEISNAVAQLLQRLKQAEKEVASLRARQSASLLDELVNRAVDVEGVRVLAAELPESVGDLRDVMDKAKAKMKSGVIVFAVRRGSKVQLIAGVTPDLLDRFHAGNLIREIAAICGGKGGGKPEMAMAGGNEANKLSQALESVQHHVARVLNIA